MYHVISTVYHMISTVCYVISTLYHVISTLVSTVCHVISTMCHVISTVYHVISTVCHVISSTSNVMLPQIEGRPDLTYHGDYCECDQTQCPTSISGTICSGKCYHGDCTVELSIMCMQYS